MKAAFTGLVFCVAALVALGLVMLYSSSLTQVGAHFMILQLAWCGLGVVACAVAANVDYDVLRRYAWPIFGVAVVLLAMVFIHHGPIVGITRGGGTRWLGHNKTTYLQPSELGKLALIIMVAWYGARYQAHMHKFWRGLFLPMLPVALVLGLVFKEPDRGTTALLAAVSGAMLVVAGVRWRFIVPPFAAAAVVFAFYLWHDPMAGKRVLAWLHPEETKSGIGYQSHEAMVALGSGGLTGLGLGNGRQKLGFVPQQHTDFIFSIIGEELGLIGTTAVMLVFVGLIVCGLHIARHARDTFGSLLAFGLTVLIGLQAAINIGVVTSALPNKGLALPFISYGGSNLVIMLTAVGLLLSVARHAPVEETLPANAAGGDGPQRQLI